MASKQKKPAAGKAAAGTIETTTGHGGETHQHNGGTAPLTTNHGVAVSDNQNSLRLGERGPTLLEDFVLREKIFHFDHERIPERIVHARGSAAHGYFECTRAIPELTRAHLFGEVGRRVPVFTRFSTVAGGAGSVDTPRDVRGFAVKLYTEEGNWDLVGNNIPVFFIQDAIKFPDLVHSVKMEADRGYPQAASAHDTFWDFASLMPESTHMLLWAMSDRTLPRSLRMMDGFGVHTFRLVNAEGDSRFVKFHWRPTLGIQSTLWDEAVKIAGADPDFHRRDLHDAIERGDFPSWDLGIQVFDDELAASLPYDVLDATKIIPEELVPVEVIGRMVLDRNPDNFFAETEQSAFLPTNVVPGIDFSDDPLLQGRLFSYLDTQKSRLGTTNFFQLPINAPKCPMANFQRDGMMQTAVPQGRANYEPNSLDQVGEEPGPREDPARGFTTMPEPAGPGAAKHRIRAELFADHYSQAAMFWRSLLPVEQGHVAAAFVFELGKVQSPHVVERMVANLGNVDAGLAQRVADGLGIECPSPSTPAREPVALDPSPALSILARHVPTLVGRKVAVVVADGTAPDLLKSVRAALEGAGAAVAVVAPKRFAALGDAEAVPSPVDERIDASPSVLFDAVALLLTDDAVAELAGRPSAVQLVADAFAHGKAIGHTAACQPLLDRANVVPDGGVVGLDNGGDGPDAFVAAAGTRFFDRDAHLVTLA